MSTAVTIGSSISDVDFLNGHEFEYWCAALLQCNGFTNVSVTRGSGDQGVDILATKDGIRYAIQCKRFNSALSNKPIQEVYTGRVHYGCQAAAVMTNSTFTTGAVALARSTGVELWDRHTLIGWIDAANGKRRLFRTIKVNNAADSRRNKRKSHPVLNAMARHPIITFFIICYLVTALTIHPSSGSPTSSTANQTSNVTEKNVVTASQDTPYVMIDGDQVEMQRIKTDTFDYIGYDESRHILVVRIPKYSSFFCYYDFPADKYEAFINSDSPDVYFNNSIGGQYKTNKVPESEAESTIPKSTKNTTGSAKSQ